MTAEPLKYMSYPMTINVRNGVPICPDCQTPMVEMLSGSWQCPEGAALWRKVSANMAEMFASAITSAQSEPPSPRSEPVGVLTEQCGHRMRVDGVWTRCARAAVLCTWHPCSLCPCPPLDNARGEAEQ